MRMSLGIVILAIAWSQPALAFDHGPFDKLLRSHVKGGRVDYGAIKSQGLPALDGYLAAVKSAKVSGLSRNAKLAFYLNAYNALVIRAVVKRYPAIYKVTSVTGFFDRIHYQVAGKKVTLNQLEKKVILKGFKEPRIHFALVCAARSCPPLRNRAFRAEGLNKVLDALARRFIQGRHGVQKTAKGFRISKLFKWYHGDFAGSTGTVGKFLARFYPKEAAALSASTTFEYLPYNWNLNRQ